jgi:hypothetical protein
LAAAQRGFLVLTRPLGIWTLRMWAGEAQEWRRYLEPEDAAGC